MKKCIANALPNPNQYWIILSSKKYSEWKHQSTTNIQKNWIWKNSEKDLQTPARECRRNISVWPTKSSYPLGKHSKITRAKSLRAMSLWKRRTQTPLPMKKKRSKCWLRYQSKNLQRLLRRRSKNSSWSLLLEQSQK